jgi:glycosyltransferase involved in cell wall biosynthesis
VLTQTFADFDVIVADNASTDGTARVTSSFEDLRVHYVRRSENLGSQENINRLLDSITTEYVLILPDDDVLYPEHLAATVLALDEYPTAGFVDTAFDMIDEDGRVQLASTRRFSSKSELELEDRRDFRARAMGDAWPVHFSTALMRTEAAQRAAPLRPDDFPPDDLGLFLRMSRDWDAAHLAACLGGYRIHGSSVTAAHGVSPDGSYEQFHAHFELVRDIKLRTIRELGLPSSEYRRLRRAALHAHRHAVVNVYAIASPSEAPFFGLRSIANLARTDGRILLTPRTWRLVAAELGGRRLKEIVRRAGRQWREVDGAARSKLGR